MKKILGTVAKWAVPILMTALPAAMFYREVMHYQAHFDSSLTGIVGIACVVGGVFLLTGAIEKKHKVNAAICGLAIASGLFFAISIPSAIETILKVVVNHIRKPSAVFRLYPSSVQFSCSVMSNSL